MSEADVLKCNETIHAGILHQRYYLFQKQNKGKLCCTINHFHLPVIWEMKTSPGEGTSVYRKPIKTRRGAKPQNCVHGIPLICAHQRVEAVQLSFQGLVSQSLKPATAPERFSRRVWLRGVARRQLSVPLFRPLKDTLEVFCPESRSHLPLPPADAGIGDTRAGRSVLSPAGREGQPSAPPALGAWQIRAHPLCQAWRAARVIMEPSQGHLLGRPASLPNTLLRRVREVRALTCKGPRTSEPVVVCLFPNTACSPGRPCSQTRFLLQ